MKGKNKQAWINQGYQKVSEDGFNSINIESIARQINKNKSSFNHYFGDLEVIEETQLAHHQTLAKQFALDTAKCRNIVPDMIDLFVDHQVDIFFHKQLRINRHKPQHKACFEGVYELFEGAIIDQRITFFNLVEQPFLATKVLKLISENFLLQITPENFTHHWLQTYFHETSSLLGEMAASSKT